MDKERTERLPHILVKDTATTDGYTRPKRKIDAPNPNIPQRNRQQHATRLISQLQQAKAREAAIIQEQQEFGLAVENGLHITFESESGFELIFESLNFRPSGIELCSVTQMGDKTTATVFVPEGKLEHFLKQVTTYRDHQPDPQAPDKTAKSRSQDLVESISAIKLTALKELWTDERGLFPADNSPITWEIWLRHSDKIDHEAFLREYAPKLGLTVGAEAIRFLDRTIVLAHGNREQLSRSITLLGSIAEVRRAKETADFFTGMERTDQKAWIEETLEQVTPPAADAPSVCLLDTGLNEQHPLLRPVTDLNGLHSYDRANWGTDDRYGHGTAMAGLAVYGDLTNTLASPGPIELSHQLESVKITPNPGHHQEKRLYGAITRDGIHRVEIDGPQRNRVFCMAVTTPDDRDRGRPSSWSATIDALTSGAEDDQQRLVLLSAGNTDPVNRHEFPENNITDEVHDPGQSWNALTVGGYTEKAWLDPVDYPDWLPVSPPGDISPSSCTSMEWSKTWPIKPDIVMEAGNMAINPKNGTADYIDDGLQLLSTGHRFALEKQLVSFGDTSAAVALASKLTANLQTEYPDYWPETLRALIVHSARWTESMKKRFHPLNKQDHYRQLLRYCGYGVPNIEDLLWSTRSALTLIAQERLQPYFREEGRIKTRDIHLHALPWPKEALLELPLEAQVEMRVTLSYFIEPSPGERGWTNKFRYASHGLRFEVRRPTESLRAFEQRINQQARDEEHKRRQSVKDSGKWVLGEKLRSLGSIHSDIWTGSAAELAERGHIAIYPVQGWWKERAHLERWGKQARYALIVTLRTPGVETDIYTPVANRIAAQIKI